MAILGVLGLLLGIGAFIYVFLTLTVSVPMISTEDNRIFQALDRSVQRTKGEKLSMFIAALPIVFIYLIGILVAVIAGGASMGTTGTPSAAMTLVSSVVTAFTATLFFSLLNEYHQRLPE